MHRRGGIRQRPGEHDVGQGRARRQCAQKAGLVVWAGQWRGHQAVDGGARDLRDRADLEGCGCGCLGVRGCVQGGAGGPWRRQGRQRPWGKQGAERQVAWARRKAACRGPGTVAALPELESQKVGGSEIRSWVPGIRAWTKEAVARRA